MPTLFYRLKPLVSRSLIINSLVFQCLIGLSWEVSAQSETDMASEFQLQSPQSNASSVTNPEANLPPSLPQQFLQQFAPKSSISARQYRRAYKKILFKYVIPVANQFKNKLQQLQSSTLDFCKDPTERALEKVRLSLHASLDEWQKLSLLGPIGRYSNNSFFYIIYHWPNSLYYLSQKNHEAISGEDDSGHLNSQNAANNQVIPAEELKKLSGLHGIEYILYMALGVSKQTKVPSIIDNEICNHLSKIAEELVAIQNTVHPSLHPKNMGSTPNFWVDAFLIETTLYIDGILNNKINPSYDLELDSMVYHNMESYISQRTYRNIALNLVASQTIYNLIFNELNPFDQSNVWIFEFSLQINKAIQLANALDKLQQQGKLAHGVPQILLDLEDQVNFIRNTAVELALKKLNYTIKLNDGDSGF